MTRTSNQMNTEDLLADNSIAVMEMALSIVRDATTKQAAQAKLEDWITEYKHLQMVKRNK